MGGDGGLCVSAPWDAPASINARLEKDDDCGINQTGDHETYKSRLRMDSAPGLIEGCYGARTSLAHLLSGVNDII